jgi:secondary thiamine-phosphate synthase enzyme
MHRVTVTTRQRCEFIDITNTVRQLVQDWGLDSGAVLIYSPHTTAGVTIQENADPDVVRDLLLWLETAIPQRYPGFRHAEGNSDSHLKASLMGPSVVIPVENQRLLFGTWQGIYFCEFDGPRTRSVLVQPLQGYHPA